MTDSKPLNESSPPAPRRAVTSTLIQRVLSSNVTAIAVALILVCIALSLLTDRFFTVSNLTSVLVQSSLVGIAAVGATFVIITGGIDLSVGANLALSGIIVATLFGLGIDPITGIALTLLISAAIGAFNGASVTWLRLAPFIVTLAVMGMARGLTLNISQGASLYDLPPAYTWFGNGNVFGVPAAVLLMLLTFVVGHILLRGTTFGHRVYAVGGNREAARLAGINDHRVLFSVYVIAGVAAGIAALVSAGRLGAATPNAGVGLELQVIAAVVIGGSSLFGGKGTMVGTFVGVLLIGVINNGLILLNVNPFLVQFVQGALIFVAVLLDSLNTRRLARGKRAS
ncbi:ABC transporter permease [Microbacterium sp. NPDC078428]|uniref:ABC transporter permease n=1 Tax=Microbacterium sp. NPDC078428 TaxID=3364190 RepID=UPI0037CB2727